MSLVFLFSTFIFTSFAQNFFECCNVCEEPAECASNRPFLWLESECTQYRPPFWPDNFCTNPVGEECLRGSCHCTRGAAWEEDTSVGWQHNNICVRSLREENYDPAWGQWLCDNSDICDDSSFNGPFCPENYYCVNSCCGDEKKRCVPCCNEPLAVPPTVSPSRSTEEPTSPTRQPSRVTKAPQSVEPDCDCTNPGVCLNAFHWDIDLHQCEVPNHPPQWSQTVNCPAANPPNFDIFGTCSCTYEGLVDSTNPTNEGVCIRDPFDNFDHVMCRCAQTCDPNGPVGQCPPDHYCIDTCCDQTGNDKYKCVPCCDTEWFIPDPTPDPTDVTPDPTDVTPDPTDVTPGPTDVTPGPIPAPVPTPPQQEECHCDPAEKCFRPFDWSQQCELPHVPSDWQQAGFQCPNGDTFDLFGRCSCTFSIEIDPTTGEEKHVQVCIRDPFDEFDDKMCECARDCQEFGPPDQCPPNHYCVQSCCDPDHGYEGNPRPWKCVPCCDTKWQI